MSSGSILTIAAHVSFAIPFFSLFIDTSAVHPLLCRVLPYKLFPVELTHNL